MDAVFIYALCEPDTGDVRYVGKAKDPAKRFKGHLAKAKREVNHRARWICFLLGRGLAPILEILDEVPRLEWPQWEAAYIQFFREEGFDLVNCTDGGDTGPDRTGVKASPEARARMSAAQSGAKHPYWGVTFSPERREKMAAPRRGRKDSEEVRRRKSVALKAWWEKRKEATGVQYKKHSAEARVRQSVAIKAWWALRKGSA